MPEIGVVVPVYNGERYLAQTLESVLAQTFTDWELVIVDDGSRDSSRAIADAFAARDARVRVVHTANEGLSSARDLGLQRLDPRSAFVIFLDADDLWYPDSLLALRKALLRDPLALGAHGAHRLIDGEGQPLLPNRTEQLYFGARRALAAWWPARIPVEWPTTFAVTALLNPIVSPGAALIRRSALRHAGGFDHALLALEDWDLWIRLTARGHLVYVMSVVLDYRRHDRNMSAHVARMVAANEAMRRTHAASTLFTVAQRQLLEDGRIWVVILLRWIWAQDYWQGRCYRRAAAEARRASWQMVRFYGRCARCRCLARRRGSDG